MRHVERYAHVNMKRLMFITRGDQLAAKQRLRLLQLLRCLCNYHVAGIAVRTVAARLLKLLSGRSCVVLGRLCGICGLIPWN